MTSVSMFVDAPSRERFQAPGEAWVGLVALLLETAASIIDVWTT